MSNKRVIDFRNRKNKIAVLNEEQQKENQAKEQMVGLVLGLSKRVFDMEKQIQDMKTLLPIAKAADYRSLSVQRLLESKNITNKDEMLRVTNEIVIEDFDLKSAQDDNFKGLEVVTHRPAEKGDFVVLNLKFFKDGKELLEEEYPRTKIHLGSYELFPELDDAVIGMKAGEKNKFPVKLLNQTDEALVSLIGIRQKRIVDGESQSEDTNVRDPDKG